jgi:hypothetical protein
MRPSQRTTGVGTRSPDTGKFSTAFVVSDPQSSCWTAISKAYLCEFCAKFGPESLHSLRIAGGNVAFVL